MPEERNKSVRINERLNKAINTLAGYHDIRADEVVAAAVALLWEKTFPGVAMPDAEGKSRKR